MIEQKTDRQKYKTVRIYPDDHVRLKRLAFSLDKSIVQVISEALDLFEEKHKK